MRQYFHIRGIPKAQGRPRFAKMGKFVKAYDPKDSRQYKDNVSAQIVAKNPKVVDGPVSLTLTFTMPRPRSHFNSKGILKPGAPPKWHTHKPDLDNLIKAIKDALKGLTWMDDSQVYNLTASKTYAPINEDVGVDVWVDG